MEDMILIITEQDKNNLAAYFGKEPKWDATEMLSRLEAEMVHFDYGRATNTLKEVWWHWKCNYKVQGAKAYRAFYNDVIIYYDEIFAIMKVTQDGPRKNN